MACRYQEGIGISQNKQAAFNWIIKAAQQGDAYAQLCASVYYTHGIGVTKNYREAFNWAMKAAQQGLSEAQRNSWFIL